MSYIETYKNFIYEEYSEQEIREFIKNHFENKEYYSDDYWFWAHITKFQTLSEDFMREFQDKLEWDHVFEDQECSESFLREFKHKHSYDYVFKHQKLSEEFLIEFVERIDPWYLFQNKNIPKDVKKRVLSLTKVIDQ